MVASLPFAPEIVLPAIDFCIHQAKLKESNAYGFKAAFNPTHPGEPGNPFGWWVSPWHFGLNEGPIVLMIENYRSGMLWRLMRDCSYIQRGCAKQASPEDGCLATVMARVSQRLTGNGLDVSNNARHRSGSAPQRTAHRQR